MCTLLFSDSKFTKAFARPKCLNNIPKKNWLNNRGEWSNAYFLTHVCRPVQSTESLKIKKLEFFASIVPFVRYSVSLSTVDKSHMLAGSSNFFNFLNAL